MLMRFRIIRPCLVVLAGWAAVTIIGCAKQPGALDSLQKRYQLTDEETARWNRLRVDQAESLSVALWSHVGRGEFDSVMSLVNRFAEPNLDTLFARRISGLWSKIVTMPAAEFLKEPQLQLVGEGKTVGFETWGDLFSSGFQRAILSYDSITVYFVFKGYWQAHAMPIYAAVSCGDFGTEEPLWRPFANIIFSLDASEETIKNTGKIHFDRDLDQFLAYLRTRSTAPVPAEKR
jgi:hypothetical protein